MAVVRNGSRSRLVGPDGYRLAMDTQADPQQVALRCPREDTAAQEEYYYAFGEALGDRYEDLVGSRIYLDVGPLAAAEWIHALTSHLNRHRVPFAFKVLRYAEAYRRVDTGVLYVSRRFAGFVASLILDLARAIGGLRSRTPLFARRLGPGIAFADSPPAGGSFGMDRMRLVAEGLVDAWRDQKHALEERRDAIVARFRWAEVDVNRPWLNAGNADLVVNPRAPAARLYPRRWRDWIEIADRLGSRLARDAIWHGDQCTWLGWALMPKATGYKTGVAAAGADLYSGTAGIALFLARLAKVTADARQQATAMAAVRHAAARACAGRLRIGAYTGLSGVLYSAMEVAASLRNDEAAARGAELLTKLVSSAPAPEDSDVVTGRAGAVRALLSISPHAALDAGSARRVAERFGRELLEQATRHDGRFSWRSRVVRSDTNLLGYSHGAAGIASALHDLFQCVGDSAFLEASDGAFAYEREHFDPSKRNWPDLMSKALGHASTKGDDPLFASAWCSGAPGTALALARRVSRMPKPALEDLLSAAIETTEASLQSRQDDDPFCLCHGTGGNAEVLLEIDRLCPRAGARDLIYAAAEDGARRFHDSGSWPCGLKGAGEAPGLLLGLAGIGHFYLRLHDSTVPSPLLL
ncbi:MAG TPA: lanthionine synthetase LanC family protein [Polyangiaceae bacterium]|nr:lanthionine synthetase LanC family protein [Polyangiaceae bacterium]